MPASRPRLHVAERVFPTWLELVVERGVKSDVIGILTLN